MISKIIGSAHQRTIKKFWPIVQEINRIEESLQAESDEALRERTRGWQKRFRAFHRPEFLAGVALRQATREDLLACAKAVHDHFILLHEHFPNIDHEAISDEALADKSEDVVRAAIESAREEWEELNRQFPVIEERLLEEILPEAFAVVKNGARRLCGRTLTVCDQEMTWDMVHFDVQLIGGIALHRGIIAEMATGEGKTLVSTLPSYLNALVGHGVHIITVNDYLAQRDAEWMGFLHEFLGLNVGCIQNSLPPDQRREQYGKDITYGTNSEFGFDYLRDNGMATEKANQVQRGHHYAIIDEVDSVLIDEARTPLIISGPVAHSSNQEYAQFNPLIDQLVKKQTILCNKHIAEAKKAQQEGDLESAALNLFKVKLGNPRAKGLMRAMEDPALRKEIDKVELSFYQDTQKTALFQLKEELYYHMDEKSHDADLSEMGRTFLDPKDPEAFTLPDLATEFADLDNNTSLTDSERQRAKDKVQDRLDTQGGRIHCINQLLKAHTLYEKDQEYVIEEGKVIIVDEQTGRKMPGRRWSDGLHQAVEAKEGVKIDRETQTLATITIQNYFRLYEKLSGMTGTAETDAAEFSDIYGLDVLPIPTNRPIQRIDGDDAIYKTIREKYNAVISLIKEKHAQGQPLLVGTASVEASEIVARLLKREKIPHSVLNAKNHMHEAEIVARAGQRGAVTVSTNMAGRGTDIKLGSGVADLGGLCVIATERHESRRIDRQLRGRCARQGDPGESKFFISFEDNLMRNFGAAERMTRMMERFGLEEGQELEHPWLNKSVETAQKRVEQRNYTWRKRVLDFDDVMNQQREVVYGYRNEVIESPEPRMLIDEALAEALPAKVEELLGPDPIDIDAADFDGLRQWVGMTFPIRLSREDAEFELRTGGEIAQLLTERVTDAYELKAAIEEPNALVGLERYIILNAIDRLWQEHLYAMDGLREGVHLRAQGQKDPLVEYKNDAFSLFEELMANIKMEVLSNLFRSTTNLQGFELFLQNLRTRQTSSANAPDGPGASLGTSLTAGAGSTVSLSSSAQVEESASVEPKINLPARRELPKVGRNELCPCGSGKKYKSCHGRSQ
jgi:preprotein translocase subunit SecA